MFILPYPREVLLKVLPKNGYVAEIGVSLGEFSEQILKICDPRKLLLVDPWIHQSREDYQRDPTNDTQEVMDERYSSVKEKFFLNDRVEIHRAESVATAAEIKESGEQIDWVYIDAVHSYKGCTEDLYAWADCISPEGMITGHDFAYHSIADEVGIHVADAVKDFCLDSPWSLVALTNELYGSYVLMKDRDAIQKFYHKMARSTLGIVQIQDFWSYNWSQALIADEYGRIQDIGGWPISILTI